MHNKRGMSEVVTTLIIILLVIVSIGIVWVVVKNILDKGKDEITLTGLTLDLEITKAVVEDEILSVTVKRNPGEGDLIGINFVISDGDNSVVVTRDTTLSELGVQTFTFTLSTLAVGEITSISIAPIFETSSGKEITGEIHDTTTSDPGDLGSGDPDYGGEPGENGEEPCTPDCGGGLFDCGDDGCPGGSCGDCEEGFSCAGNQTCMDASCPDEDPSVTCSGLECGTLFNNCGNDVTCGNCTLSYNESYVCSDYQCVFEPECTDNCSILGYECGIHEICGDPFVDCEVEEEGCDTGYECIPGNNLCQQITYLNSGTVDTVWPPTKNTYFDTDDPPIDDPALNYASNYIKFPGSAESECLMIQKSVVPEYPESPPYYNKTIIYLFAIQTDVAPNDNYEIWETYEDCYGI